MKKLGILALIVFAVLGLSKPTVAMAMSKKQNIQLDILALDAIMDLASVGVAGALYAAADHKLGFTPPNYADLPPEASEYSQNIQKAARRGVLGYCLTCNTLSLVSKSYTPLLVDFLTGGFAPRTDATILSRKATTRLAQSAQPQTWGPDLLWKRVGEATLREIEKGASEEEIGLTAAQVTWEYVFGIRDRINEAVRSEVTGNYLVTDFNAGEALTLLRKSMDASLFNGGLPQVQEFYRSSILSIEKSMKAAKLIN